MIIVREEHGVTVNTEQQNNVEYLSIDPGSKNGLCGYDANFSLVFMTTVFAKDMIMFMQQFKNVKKCICESYRVYSHKAKQHINSDLETVRVIGRIEHWAGVNGIELIMQPATIKNTGYKWLGQKPLPKTNPLNHQMDAHVHFIYWGVKSGKIKLEDLRKNDRV